MISGLDGMNAGLIDAAVTVDDILFVPRPGGSDCFWSYAVFVTFCNFV